MANSKAKKYARRIQAAVSLVLLILAALLATALSSRPQTVAIFILWLTALATFFATDESFVLHRSQEEENKFWTVMSFTLSFLLLFVAQDSPLLLPRSTMGVGLGALLLFGLTFYIRLVHNQSHSSRLRVKSSIPKNDSYRSLVSSLKRTGGASILLQTVLSNVAKLEQRSDHYFTSRKERDAEEEIMRCFQAATRAELNHLALHVGLTLVLYHLRNHIGAVQYRDDLLELLCNKRLAELTTSAKVSVLDALQSLGGFVHNSPEAQRCAAQVLLNTHGQSLSNLKTLSDSKGCVRSMHRLIFHDISNSQVRQQVLEHFERNAVDLCFGRKIVSDIDDTFISSGGKYPAGMDDTYKRHVIYPAAGAFYEALDLGNVSPNSSINTETDSARALRFQYGSSRDLLNKTTTQFVGNLAFLSARPHVYKDVSEKMVYDKFARFINAGKLYTMPTLLSGDLGSGRMFMLMGDFRPMALKKFRNMMEYYAIYPDYKHVFVCDNGQGDVLAAEMMKEKLGDRLEAVFCHLVQPIEHTFGYESREKWRFVCFYRTFVGAAVHACRLGLIDTASLRHICLAACSDFVELKEGEKQRFELICDLEQANHLLKAESLFFPVSYPPSSHCLFPVGSKILMSNGIKGEVQHFRWSDGVYTISMFGGLATCYLTALSPGIVAESLREQQTAPVNNKQFNVMTPYGPGIAQHFRVEDQMYQVNLMGWRALAYVKKDDVKFERSATAKIWDMGKSMFQSVKSSIGALPLSPSKRHMRGQRQQQVEEELDDAALFHNGDLVDVKYLGVGKVEEVRLNDRIASVQFEPFVAYCHFDTMAKTVVVAETAAEDEEGLEESI